MNGTAALIRRILVNDLRLYFRAWQRRGAGRFGGLGLQILFPAWMHLAVYPLLMRYGGPVAMPGAAEFACLFVAVLVVMVALQRSLEVLYNRGDLPMLLASPVPMRVVVFTRLADIQMTTWLASGLVMLPLIDVAVWLHGRYWLWAWVAWLFAGLTLVPFALWLTLSGMRLFGPQRARAVIQVFSLALGVCAVAGAQAPNWLGQAEHASGRVSGHARFFATFDGPALRPLAQAARGNAFWLSMLALAGLLFGAAAFALLVRDFARGAQLAAGDVGRPARGSNARRLGRLWGRAFRQSPLRAIMQKELRLVRRDPLLIVRGSAQMVSLLPALAVVLWQHTAAGVAAFALIGPAIVAVTIATMMTLNDEAAILTRSSPLSLRRAAWARTLAAATIPTGFALALAGGASLLGESLVAVVAAIGGTLNAVALAWLGTCTVRPLSPEDRAQNRRPKVMSQYLFAMLVGGLGAAGVTLLAMDQRIAASALLAISLAGAASAFIARPKMFADEVA